MKLRLLSSAILAGLVLQPASAETRKVPGSPVVTRPVAKPLAAPVPALKKPAPSAKPASDSATAVKPTAGKKALSLKALFSRKPAPAPPPDPQPKTVAVTVKKPSPVKAKAVSVKPEPVIPRNTGEFINISFPEPRSRKRSTVATDTAGH